MAKYLVPASYEYHGYLEIEAESASEALDKSYALNYGQIKDQLKANGPSVDVWIAEEEHQVELDDGDAANELLTD